MSKADFFCPVCLEERGTLLPLSCSHYIHIGCAKGLTKTECPICRSEVKNWPEFLKNIISENEIKRKEELCDEDNRTVFEFSIPIRSFPMDDMHLGMIDFLFARMIFNEMMVGPE